MSDRMDTDDLAAAKEPWVETLDTDLLARSGAWISHDGAHRFRLWREWDAALPPVVFVMLNPSTADALADDPTIRKCVGFAKRWGFGRVDVLNLWSVRSTDWRGVLDCPFPSPQANSDAWEHTLVTARVVVAAWGAHRPTIERRHENGRCPSLPFLADDHDIVCLGRSKDGEPRHPLMLSYDTERLPWPFAPEPDRVNNALNDGTWGPGNWVHCERCEGVHHRYYHANTPPRDIHSQ